MSEWTEEQTKRLTALWERDDKPSSTEVADILNDEFGMNLTRSAVIGKVHRLKLDKRGSNGNYKGNGREKLAKRPSKPNRRISTAPRAVTPPEVILRCVAIDPLHLSLLDLEPHHCRYPYGQGPFTFCGHHIARESSYCDAHTELCQGEGTVAERMAAPLQRNRHTLKASARWGTYEAA